MEEDTKYKSAKLFQAGVVADTVQKCCVSSYRLRGVIIVWSECAVQFQRVYKKFLAPGAKKLALLAVQPVCVMLPQ